jgi:hypothetical protein
VGGDRERRADAAGRRCPRHSQGGLNAATVARVPDGAFVIHYADGRVQYALVEIEMGTMPLQRFRQKMRAFNLHLDEVWRRKPEWRYEVYVLASSYNRREELRETSKTVIGGRDRYLFMFGTMLMLQPQAFGGYGWVDLNDIEKTVLFMPDDEDDVEVTDEAG